MDRKIEKLLAKARNPSSWMEQVQAMFKLHKEMQKQLGASVTGIGGKWGLKELATLFDCSIGKVSQDVKLGQIILMELSLGRPYNKKVWLHRIKSKRQALQAMDLFSTTKEKNAVAAARATVAREAFLKHLKLREQEGSIG